VLTVGEHAKIGDDLIGAGQSLETRLGSSVGGALLFGGGQALLAGDVAEGVRIGTGGLELRGRIGGDVKAAVGSSGAAPSFSPLSFLPDLPPVPEVAPGLMVGHDARIEGDLEYVGEQEIPMPPGAVRGRVTHRTPEPAAPPSTATAALGALRTFGALLVVGLLLLWLAPTTVKGGAAALQARPGPSLGWGVVSFFAAIAGVLALALSAGLAAVALGMLSLGGLTALAILGGIVSIFAFVLAFVVVAFYVSKVVSAFLAGRWLLARIKPGWAERWAAPLLVGVLALVVLGMVPFLGGLIHLAAALFGLGALWLLARDRFRKGRPSRPVSEPVHEVEPLKVALPPAA
jgi:hypothetical protein